uniref:LAGLIDADG endonuclease n=1 Tax=Phylloporia weberiana TaxID=1001332 RepID=UPI002E775D87|nr:LAGLIDADG endonuclease [Ganoderma weberianum]WQH62868.1 LAGLIDADG endonuclease [Ganoderma weberianum]
MSINWLCGFMSADGHFALHIRKNSKFTLGANCYPIISRSQDGVSLITLEYIVSFLGAGKVTKDSHNRTTYVYYLASLKNIQHFINKIEGTDIIGLGQSTRFCRFL